MDKSEAHSPEALFKCLTDMLRLLEQSQEALDTLAQDVADEFPVRAENATNLAMACRIVIARAKGNDL